MLRASHDGREPQGGIARAEAVDHRADARDAREERGGDTLSYIKTFYALFSWPFLIFMVPVVGGAFAEARPTAYDKSGMLCPNLSSGQLKTKYDFEKENRIGDFSPRKGWQGRLAMV